MFEIISAVLGNVLSGGATGLIGVLIQRIFDFKNKDQDIRIVQLNHENSLALSKMEFENKVAEGDRQLEIRKIDFEQNTASLDSADYIKSVDSDTATYIPKFFKPKKDWAMNISIVLMSIVDFCRGILRPGMTAYLLYLMTMMFLWVKDISPNISPEQAMQLKMLVLSTLTYVFTTCATWWFGTRPPKKDGDK